MIPSTAIPPSSQQEPTGGPGLWIFISGLFNVPGIKMLIKDLRAEIYFGGMARVNYEKGRDQINAVSPLVTARADKGPRTSQKRAR